MQQRPISAELALAVACCRWPPSTTRDNAVRAAVGPGLDWQRFDRLVSRNRIGALVHHGLTSARIELPDDLAERFSRRAAAAARQSLALARESFHLQREFDATGIPNLILKGAPLALLAYDDLSVKESCDIDLLVSYESGPQAIELMRHLGFEGDLCRMGSNQIDGYLRHFKEGTFVHRETRLVIDLHWRLVDNPGLLAGVGIDSPVQNVAFPGGPLRTLGSAELFAYLCVHGSLHNWARLKWLADLGAFLSSRPHDEVERLYASAEELGAARAASISLALCQRLLGLKLSEGLKASLRQDRVALALQANVLAGLGHKGGTKDPERYSVGWIRKVVAQFLLEPGLRHFFHQARFYWNFPEDRTWLSLPRPLEFLYGVLRIPLWLGRLVARTFRILANRRDASRATMTGN